MVIQSFAQEMRRADNSPAFSNGFEGESWMAVWCAPCGHADSETGGCTLIDVAHLGKTPFSWEPLYANSLARRYICHEHEPATSR